MNIKAYTRPIGARLLFAPNVAVATIVLLISIMPSHSASDWTAPLPPAFRQTYTTSLNEFWCENHLDVADLNGDGTQDIVLMLTALTNPNAGPPWRYKAQVRLLIGDGAGRFESSVLTNFPGAYGYGAYAADVNNDGLTDLILREQARTHVLLNSGRGEFREVWTGTPGYYGLAKLDANRDGFLDFASGTQTGQGGLIELFINDGSGRFTKTWQSSFFGWGSGSVSTVLALNLNGDGISDLASREIYSGLLITHTGASNAPPFVQSNAIGLGDRTFALAAGDVNRDGRDDVAAYVGWGQVQLFMNQGNGSLSNAWQSSDFGQAAFNLALADFDQDGAQDIFVGTFQNGRLEILRNVGSAGFVPWWTGSVHGNGYNGTVADLNADGWPDLIAGGQYDIRVLFNTTGKAEIGSVRPTPEGTTVTGRLVPGRRYQLQFKDQMEEVFWKDTGDVITATNAIGTWLDAGAASMQQRFYQVMEVE